VDAIDKFMASHDWALLERVKKWKVQRKGDVVRLSLCARDGQCFFLQCACSGYPERAPSVAFVNEEGSKSDPRSWPAANKSLQDIIKPPPNSFLCMSLTLEGLAHHKDWAGDPSKQPWSPKNTLMDVFNVVQRLLDHPDYNGRAA
jgi:hypothetical protein